MLLPASSEFISLCQSQVALLLQSLGATEIAVYMTEQLESNAAFKPLVVYPEVQNIWPESIQWQLEGASLMAEPLLLNGLPEGDDNVSVEYSTDRPLSSPVPNFCSADPLVDSDVEQERQQIVLPLMHDNTVLGLVMVARLGQPWSGSERSQVEQVASTLSMACVLDQRSQWLSRTGFEKQALLSDEHQRLAKLLHQFRNPLTALRTLGKLMLRRMTGQDPNRTFAESIVQQSDRLEVMLQEFSQTLDVGEEAIDSFDQSWTLSPVETSPVLLPATGVISGANLSLQPCWLAEVLNPIVAAMVGRLEERQMTLHRSIPTDLPPIEGDLQALTEIFSNLLDNAIKYTPEGGLITIQLSPVETSETGRMQTVIISDTGFGIPAQDLTRIFEGQYRGIQAQSDIPGTGLGLALARELVQKMNGSIEAFSPALSPSEAQQGSTFIVTLPELTRP